MRVNRASRNLTGNGVMERKIMKKFGQKFAAFIRDEAGTETLEWGLVCGLIVVGAIVAITAIGPKVTNMWNQMDNKIPDAD